MRSGVISERDDRDVVRVAPRDPLERLNLRRGLAGPRDHVGPEHENVPVSQKCGAGRGRVHGAVDRKRISQGIEFLDRIECVSAEEEQTGIAQGDRFLAGVNCRHYLRIERELLVSGGEQFHRIRISAGKQNAVVGK